MYAADIRGRAFLDQLTIGDVAAFQRPPCFLRRMHRAGGAVSQAPGMVRVRVRENDRVGSEPFKPSEPIKAAINHHVGAAIRHEQRTVHAMPPRPRFDFPTRAEKRELHALQHIWRCRRLRGQPPALWPAIILL